MDRALVGVAARDDGVCESDLEASLVFGVADVVVVELRLSTALLVTERLLVTLLPGDLFEDDGEDLLPLESRPELVGVTGVVG